MKNKILYLLSAILILIWAFCLDGCSKPDLSSSVSELRKDVFMGESETFDVVVYSGTKENPAIFDGVVNPSALSLMFKIGCKEDMGEQITIKFSLENKDYEIKTAFSPVKSTLYGQTEVHTLPKDKLDIEILWGDKREIVCTNSMLKKDTISYMTALEKAGEKAKDFISSHTKKGIFKGEIIIRLLSENDVNYYYIGFIDDKGLKVAYLIDGKSGEVIAEKKN